ncbi:hypothetical protein NC651_029308 [Populus alba x Populus x berolinensis]|nr:hypothetical protein NC651_029308 [Populus alba x Populus x berolinensis]
MIRQTPTILEHRYMWKTDHFTLIFVSFEATNCLVLTKIPKECRVYSDFLLKT